MGLGVGVGVLMDLVARTARAADAMRVVLDVAGRVVVDHVRDGGHVDAAAEHVGSDDDRDLAGLEGVECALALALVLVPVHGRRRAAQVAQVLVRGRGRGGVGSGLG